jgi:hypothetical protein
MTSFMERMSGQIGQISAAISIPPDRQALSAKERAASYRDPTSGRSRDPKRTRSTPPPSKRRSPAPQRPASDEEEEDKESDEEEDSGHEAHVRTSPALGGAPGRRQVEREALTPAAGLQRTPQDLPSMGKRAASTVEKEPCHRFDGYRRVR